MEEEEETTYSPLENFETSRNGSTSDALELEGDQIQSRSCFATVINFLQTRSHQFWLYVIIVVLIALLPMTALLCHYSSIGKCNTPEGEEIENLKQKVQMIRSDFDRFREKSKHQVTILEGKIMEFNQNAISLKAEIQSALNTSQNFKTNFEKFRIEANSTHVKLFAEMQSNEKNAIMLEQIVNDVKTEHNGTRNDFENYRRQSDSEIRTLKNQSRTLQTLNERVTAVEEQNKNKISSLKADLVSVKQNLDEVVESDCGGIISIPTTKDSYFLQYKLNRTYDSKENCLWIVENSENSIRSQLTLQVELVSQELKGNAGLFVLKWNPDAKTLASEQLSTGKHYNLTAEGLYFSFTSDDEASMGGKGFLLRISVIHIQLKTYGSNLFYRTPSGSHTVSSYQGLDQVSIVINPRKSMTFIINSYDTEPDSDVLYVYEILTSGRIREKQRVSGKSTNPLSFETMSPVLSIFSSDASKSYTGFRISWM